MWTVSIVEMKEGIGERGKLSVKTDEGTDGRRKRRVDR